MKLVRASAPTNSIREQPRHDRPGLRPRSIVLGPTPAWLVRASALTDPTGDNLDGAGKGFGPC